MLNQEIRSIIRDVPDFPKQGVVFKDITPVLKDSNLCIRIIESFVKQLRQTKVDAVVGVESRGFLFGMMLANALDVPFIPIRKKGKLPYKVFTYEYNLEYGSAEIEIHADAIQKNWNVILHDDLLATGGTALAGAKLIEKLGGNIAAFAFIIELEYLNGSNFLKKYSNRIISLVKY